MMRAMLKVQGMPSDRLIGPETRLADSLTLGLLSMLMGILAVACLVTTVGEPVLSWKLQLGTFFAECPLALAILNMYFSYRDEKRGLRRQARVGLALSFLAPVVAVAPLLFVD
jgi:hypothetical protein